MTCELNYVQRIESRLREVCTAPMRAAHVRAYAQLVLTVGVHVTLEHVHDAWSVVENETQPGHRSLIPFNELMPEVAELDRPYAEAVRQVAAELAGPMPVGVFVARRKPTVAPSLVWTGENVAEMQQFTGGLFKVDTDGTAWVFGRLRQRWNPVVTGDVVVQGRVGEFYAVEKESYGGVYEIPAQVAA